MLFHVGQIYVGQWWRRWIEELSPKRSYRVPQSEHDRCTSCGLAATEGQRCEDCESTHFWSPIRSQLLTATFRTLQDIEIENIGKGVDDLHELAKMANEEVKLQSKMLDTLEAKIDDVHDHVTNVNAKLKTTLEEARKSDKICMVSRWCAMTGCWIIGIQSVTSFISY